MMKALLFKIAPLNADLVAILLRLAFGGLFIFHGWSKIEAFDQYYSTFPDFIGMDLLPGWRVVIPIFITMVIAYFIAHGADAFVSKELPFLFMFLSIVVFPLGSGRYSIDKTIFKNGRSF